MTQMGSRVTVTSLELFLTIFDRFFNNCHKDLHLRFAGILDLTLITDIFASQSWILISFKPIFPLYRNQSMNSDSKEDACCYEMEIY